jgi:tRNA wybutosine-synthesizing protein 3
MADQSDKFLRRKKQQLSKPDRSLKQDWDDKILNLCEKINKLDNYYTTSSCSGRVLVLKDVKEKKDDVIIGVWHDKINIELLKGRLNNIEYKGIIYFKCEPCILHVACRTLEDAQKFIDLASKIAGWKRYGIITSGRRFVVEINGTERIEFPIVNKGKVIVSNDFLKLIVDESNEKIEASWKKIQKLEESINSLEDS